MQLTALPKGNPMSSQSSIPESQPTRGHLYRKSSGAIVLHTTLTHLQVGTSGGRTAQEGKAAALLNFPSSSWCLIHSSAPSTTKSMSAQEDKAAALLGCPYPSWFKQVRCLMYSSVPSSVKSCRCSSPTTD